MRANISHTKKTGTKRGSLISRKPKKRFSQTKNKNLPVEQVLHLQRTIGNRAVNRLIQSGAIQAKLTIGKPNDIYEKEADRVADRVMSMPEGKLAPAPASSPSPGRQEEIQTRSLTQRQPNEEEKEGIQTKPLADQITPLIQRQPEEEEEVQTKLQRQAEEEEETAQAKATPGNTPGVTPNIESGINAMKGGGHPLVESTRSFFEPRFGTDFSHVRLHTDSRAANTAQAINAKAFTTGHNIAFAPNQYAPHTTPGKHLLAHELTHVLQQNIMTFTDKKIQGLFESIKLGGEVNNNTDIPWLISGKSNSKIEDFIWLPPGKNSDELKQVEARLDGDVDGVWPNSTPVKNKEIGKIVSDGAFKLNDLRDTDINGNAKKGYEISSFSEYRPESKLPEGWALPGALRRKK